MGGMARRWLQAGGWLLGWVVLGACGATPAARPVDTTTSVVTSASAPASAAPAPASAAAPVVTVQAAPQGSPWERRALAEGKSDRRIACGTSWCEAFTQRCDLKDGAWSCQPVGSSTMAADTSVFCDDGTDCPQGETCCQQDGSSATSYACVARAEVTRGVASCSQERCTASTPYCPSGQSCLNDVCQSPARQAAAARATCGAKRCPADQPVCLAGKGDPRCITDRAASDYEGRRLSETDGSEVSLYACTRASDCGAGRSCCTGMTYGDQQTFCAGGCDVSNTMKVCTSDADCRAVADAVCPKGDGECRKKMACRGSTRGPLRTCSPG